jgi:lipopolysaccharide transport system permease protein
MSEISTPADVWIIEPRSAGVLARLAEVWRYRRMFWFFGERAFRRLYQNTVLGRSWILIRPLVPVLTGVFVFGELLDVSEATTVPYFLFLSVSMAAWELFATSLMWATRSLQLNGGILTKVYVPRLILPLATMTPGLAYFVIHVGIIAVAVGYYRYSLGVWYVDPVALLMAPVTIVLIIAFALSIGLWTSVLSAETRDVRFGLAFALQFWVYVTPVMYPLTLVPGNVQWAFMLNPMAVLVVAFRGAVFGNEWPDLWAWSAALGIIALLLAIGLAFFQRAEAKAIDGL